SGYLISTERSQHNALLFITHLKDWSNCMNPKELRTIAVIGAGTMGHGIAQVSAQAGYDVWLYDVTDELLARARARIADNLSKGVARGKLTAEEKEQTLAAIQTSTELERPVAAADLIIEAVVEDLHIKRDLFKRLEAICPLHTTLATNTSSLSIAEIASAVSAPSRVIGMHFFNPAHVMKLLEIVVAPQTSEAALH